VVFELFVVLLCCCVVVPWCCVVVALYSLTHSLTHSLTQLLLAGVSVAPVVEGGKRGRDEVRLYP
jgi:hypothetical protein